MPTHDMRFATPKTPRGQHVLFPRCLDDVVAADDPVRIFAEVLNKTDWAPWEQGYKGYGQPPIHPRYLAGAILWGLLHKMRSSRDLERAACKDLDFIWLLEGFTPDHSTFADFRKRHAKAIEALREQFGRALVRMANKSLLSLILDGTQIRAHSDRHGPRKAETLKLVLRALERRMQALEQGDEAQAAPQTEYFEGMAPPEDETQALAQIDQEMARLEAQRAKYQKALDVAEERDARARKHNGKKAKAVRVPVTDPDAHMMPNKDGGCAPNYTCVATVEADSGAIVHSDVLEGMDEASAVLPAVEAAEALTGQEVEAVLADSNFASGAVLGDLDERSVAAYMPTRSASPPDNPALRADPTTPVAEAERERLARSGGQLARTAFVYDPEADVYYCPMGHALVPYKRGANKDGVACTYYGCPGGAGCPLAQQCIKGKGGRRTLVRDAYEPLREAAARRMATPEGKKIYAQRAPVIEGLYGVVKSVLLIRQFYTRGLENVRNEWNWVCAAYNLKKLLALTARFGGAAAVSGLLLGLRRVAGCSGRLLAACGATFRQRARDRKRLTPRAFGPAHCVPDLAAA